VFTNPANTDVDELTVDASKLIAYDIQGVGNGFITHDVYVEGGSSTFGDTIKGLFVADEVAGTLQGTAQIVTTTEGGGGSFNEVQKLVLDATDGSFRLFLQDDNINDGVLQATAEILYTSFDTDAVAQKIEEALYGFTGISVQVVKLTDLQFEITFLGTEDTDINALETDDSLLTIGSRELRVLGGLPEFIRNQPGVPSATNPTPADGVDVLRGATIKIISGSGIGQIRLIIANTADTITVATPWSTPLDDSSRIEILRYTGVVMPTVQVSIVGDDAPGLDVRETEGGTFAVEAPQIHGFISDPFVGTLGLVDSVTVALSMIPTGTVTVGLDGTDSLDNEQLFFAVETSPGTYATVTDLEFTTVNWKDAVEVFIFGVQDELVEGLHKPKMTLTANGGGYTNVVSSVVVDLWDDEAPGVLVIESNGTTDVIETGHGNFDGKASASVTTKVQGVAGDNAANEVQVLTIAADSGTFQLRLQDPSINDGDEQITGNIVFNKSDLDATATAIQNALNAFADITVSVTASEVDGFDYIGKFTIEFTAPGETNVAGLTVIIPGIFGLALSNDDQAPLDEFTLDDYQVVLTRAPQGTATVTTTVEGGFGTGNEANPIAEEVQVLSIDATGGTFTLTLRDAFFNGGVNETTAPITYDPGAPDTVAADIQAALEALASIGGVSVEVDGTDFVITFTDPADTNIPQLRADALKLTQEESITINLVAEPTRTQRGAGLWGIRAYLPEVELEAADTGELFLTFDQTNWFTPQTVNVAAVADKRVDGQDAMSFPITLDLANSIQGPLVITGGMSEDRSADLEREPLMLPDETNFKPSVGQVQETPEGFDPSFTLTIDLDEVVDGETAVRTLTQGGAAGVARIVTNTNGAPADGENAARNEIQVLTIDAVVQGYFKLLLIDTVLGLDATTGLTALITFNPNDPIATANSIQTRLNALSGVTVDVEGSGSTFFITFTSPAGQDVAPMIVVEADLSRVGAKVETLVESGSGNNEVQELTVFGNAGTFQLVYPVTISDLRVTDWISFDPDDPQATATAIKAAIEALDVGSGETSSFFTVNVEGSNTTYRIEFIGTESEMSVSFCPIIRAWIQITACGLTRSRR
jgi:hypothetical protein